MKYQPAPPQKNKKQNKKQKQTLNRNKQIINKVFFQADFLQIVQVSALINFNK